MKAQIPLGVGLWDILVGSFGRGVRFWDLSGHLGVPGVETPLRQLAKGATGRLVTVKGLLGDKATWL